MDDDDDKNSNDLVQLVGTKNMKFIPLIFHLIVCEDSYYGNKNN